MDYRQFERANEQCKPKHFGPPTALQRRLSREAAYRLAPAGPGLWRRIARWPRSAAGR